MPVRREGGTYLSAGSTPPDGLHRWVANELRAEIADGSLKPGDRLRELAVAARFQVSQGPVREALRLLEHEGLVSHRPRRGAYVTQLSAQDIDEIYSLRSALEGLAARRFLRYQQPHDFAELEGYLQTMEAAARARDATALVEAALQLHEAICRLSRHQRLLRSWQDIVAQTRYFARMAGHFQDDLWDDVRRHRAILDALHSGDPDVAERASKRHAHHAGHTLLQAAVARGLLVDDGQTAQAHPSTDNDWAVILDPGATSRQDSVPTDRCPAVQEGGISANARPSH